MSQEQIRTRAPSGKRIILSESVPLSAPISIRIDPARVCSFRCETMKYLVYPEDVLDRHIPQIKPKYKGGLHN